MPSVFRSTAPAGRRNRPKWLGSLILLLLPALSLYACSNLGAWDLIAQDRAFCKKRIEVKLDTLA